MAEEKPTVQSIVVRDDKAGNGHLSIRVESYFSVSASEKPRIYFTAVRGENEAIIGKYTIDLSDVEKLIEVARRCPTHYPRPCGCLTMLKFAP